MKKLPANLIIQKNKVATESAWLVLMDIWLNDEAGTRFQLVRNNENFVFGSDDYTDAECVAHYKLKDNTDTNVADASGNGHAGIASANTSTLTAVGKLGDAFDFVQASSHKVTVSDHADLNFGTGDFTVSLWAVIDGYNSLGDSWNALISKGDIVSGPAAFWGIFLDSSNKVHFIAEGSGDSTWVISDDALNDTEWHHIVAVRSDGTLYLYIDGVLQADTGASSYDIDNASDLIIAGDAGSSRYFDGKIDDVKIYDRALSQEENVVEYNSGNGTEKLPVVYNAFNFELDDIPQDSKGQIPTLNARVSNVTRLLQPYMSQLKGGVGSVVILKVVNTELPVEDYTELSMEFNVLAANSTRDWVTFTLGGTNPMRKRFPLYKMLGLHCGWNYNRPSGAFPECGYAGSDIDGITLTSGNPVSIQVTGHLFSTGDILSFLDVTGTTELNENSYTVTKTDANNFTLDDTDGDDFTAWGSAGTVGFASCSETLSDCRLRENSSMFGGCPGMRSKSVRIV